MIVHGVSSATAILMLKGGEKAAEDITRVEAAGGIERR